ncbi:helix-turn-helix domain-containing protein [Mycolicibacterium sp. 018/SC-01/001]|uniref:helix-turn-helix transcriptional regulator n=1 Tax=Mycolicibacterium sp. 018/SC-01/001 TaxID=2592069 RepID=UPI001180AE34|nr:helix-turn-helix domain-containing protein [Mycolicibacterium sp. 018/SC-01/001]TRW78996.1 helix-turn-helix domain-containing protein [Mycolicibacterium sp. 018/SC-01/001]
MTSGIAVGTPDPSLRAVVRRYEGFATHGVGPVTFREVACTFVPIIIDLGAGWSVAHRQDAPTRLQSFVAGLTDAPVLVSHGGSARCLQIDLTPLGARRVLGLPLSELANRSVPVEAVLGRDAAALVQRIGEARCWEERFALVDALLMRRLADAPDIDPGVAWSLGRITASGGRTAIGALAEELGWSHRRLITRYRDAIGLPPKTIARIVRFERALEQVRTGAALSEIATDCGYFDQAHLCRDVRELSGLTPAALRSGVNSVQDVDG